MAQKTETEIKNPKSCNWKPYDSFGTCVAPFKSQGFTKYSTIYGIFVSFVLYTLMFGMIGYYLNSFFRVDSHPSTQFSEYRDADNLSGDLASSDQHMKFSLLFQNTKTGQYLRYNELVKSFDLKAYIMEETYSLASGGYLTTDETATYKTVTVSSGTISDWIATMSDNGTTKQNDFLDLFSIWFEYDSLPVSYLPLVSMNTLQWELSPCEGPSCTNLISIEDLCMKVVIWNPTLELTNRYDPISIQRDYTYEYTFDSSFQKHLKMLLKEINITTESGKLIPQTWDKTVIAFDRFQENNIKKTSAYSSNPHLIMTLVPTNQQINAHRSYDTLFDLLSKIGGFGKIITYLAFLFYFKYNKYFYSKYLVLSGVLADDEYYPKKYQLTKDYDSLKCGICNIFKCCKKKNEAEKKLLGQKQNTISACEKIISERLDLVNYINNSMEFQIIRDLFLKARHHALIPLLSISQADKSNKDKGKKEATRNNGEEKVRDKQKEDREPKTGEPITDNCFRIEESLDNSNVDNLKKDNEDVVHPTKFIEAMEEEEIPEEIDSAENEHQDKMKSLGDSRRQTIDYVGCSDIKIKNQSFETQNTSTMFPPIKKKTAENDLKESELSQTNRLKNANNSEFNEMKQSNNIHSTYEITHEKKINPKIAYIQLYQNLHHNKIEKIVDQYFVKNLPTDIADEYDKAHWKESGDLKMKFFPKTALSSERKNSSCLNNKSKFFSFSKTIVNNPDEKAIL